ncbi:type I restriction endonuclease subunit R [Micromonospora zhanjiangensis]
MDAVHTEKQLENAIETALLGAGWQSGPDNYRPELALDTGELVTFLGATQAKVWERLVERHGDRNRAQAEFGKLLAAEIDGRGTLDVLRHGVRDRGTLIRLAYFRPGHTLAAGALDQYDANRLTVARQLQPFERGTGAPDLTLFLNGIPVATAELKNPGTGSTVEDAKKQYRRRDHRERFLARRTLVHFAVDPDMVFLTTRLAGEQTRFLPFNTGSAGPGLDGGAGNPPAAGPDRHRTAYLWERVWQRDNWLDLLHRFLHVEKPAGAKGRRAAAGPMIFPRFHQWHAVRELTGHAAAHGAGHNYLVQHSAGSGKSNTIGWLAHRLSSLHSADNELVFDKIVVLTDRLALDRQLQDTIYQFDHVVGVVKKIDQDSAQLADALTGQTARIIITTGQKFPFILEKISQAGKAKEVAGRRYAIIVDEAHSGQTGEISNKLKEALGQLGSEDGDLLTAAALARGRHPNLSYFAFTATPKQKTIELFGTPRGDEVHPFHIYSMRQAIDEGFILDVLRNYLMYRTYWRLKNAAADEADREVDPRKAKAKLVRAAELHPTSQEQRARIIVDHFREHTEHRLDHRAKAMVVTGSREHAVRLYHAIRAYVAKRGFTDCGTLVAFSQTVTLDGTDFTETKLNGFGEKELPDRFEYVAADDPHAATRNQPEYRLLVVADKYQTGFDQPLLTTMYVDKQLRGVAAVQTLSRLNRTHPLKDQSDICVLDFVNDAHDIQESFRPYFRETVTQPTDPNLLYQLERNVKEFQLLADSEIVAFGEAFAAGNQATATRAQREKAHAQLQHLTDPAVDRFEALAAEDPEAAEEFRAALTDYTRAYGFLSQVVGYEDRQLEALYYFARYLWNRLPRPRDPGVDIGEVDLTHLRITKRGEADVRLSAEDEAAPLRGLSGEDAARPARWRRCRSPRSSPNSTSCTGST